MDNMSGILGVRRMDEIRNERIQKICGMVRNADDRKYTEITCLLDEN